MATLNELLARKAELEAEIKAHKVEVIASIRAQMEQMGITLADLGAVSAKPPAKRAIKYRDEKGQTWTGVGQRPRWVRDALLGGATLEQFAVKP